MTMTCPSTPGLQGRHRLPALVRDRLGQFLRYCAVSAIATGSSMVVLGALVHARATTAGWANVIATAVGTVPSFELNRRWVWGRNGRRSVGREIAPFTVLSFSGLAISTWLVSLAAAFADAHRWSDDVRTLATELASLAAFGSLWILQFVLLDRVLFRRRGRSDAPQAPARHRG